MTQCMLACKPSCTYLDYQARLTHSNFPSYVMQMKMMYVHTGDRSEDARGASFVTEFLTQHSLLQIAFSELQVGFHDNVEKYCC